MTEQRDCILDFSVSDPILLTYEGDKGKRGVLGLVSGRFGAGMGSRWVPDG